MVVAQMQDKLKVS